MVTGGNKRQAPDCHKLCTGVTAFKNSILTLSFALSFFTLYKNIYTSWPAHFIHLNVHKLYFVTVN